MDSVNAWRARCAQTVVVPLAPALAACGGGGGTGTEKDSGINKTYLSVEVADAEGDALTYQWRVTAGTIENRNAKDTVWTMPDGPGLHFAYVTVSDGKGGYVEQQYAVASDTLGTSGPTRAATSHAAPALTEPEGATMRLRFVSNEDFADAGAASAVARYIYLPDVQVTVLSPTDQVLFTGQTDLSGELKLPKLPPLAAPAQYKVRCATSPGAPLRDCAGSFSVGDSTLAQVFPPADPAANLHVFGHVAMTDGAVCGHQNEFFSIQAAATVQVQTSDGTALSTAVHVNRFGDYAVDAAVPVGGDLQLAVRCEGYSATSTIPRPAGGFVGAAPIKVSPVIANSRPTLVKMVATGADGNVRGKMIVGEAGASSNGLPGADHFLTYKGLDTRLSVCQYYRALGAVAESSCADPQGTMVDPISFDDWKRLNGFKPNGTTVEHAANYINRRDLNLVRRMVATKVDDTHIAFYVCNHPGPLGTTQQEVDDLIAAGLNDEKRVACVAMEWTPTPGVNGGKPFTKFFTFGPSGALLPSVNLDGRGEKYLPGACVACHGGSKYNGKFPEKGRMTADPQRAVSSAYLGSNFLPFDTGNYLFSTAANLTEAAQSAELFELNKLVRATETPIAPATSTATTNLINGWYHNDTRTVLDKLYVPPNWMTLSQTAGFEDASEFYGNVVGSSCRTCHTSLGASFDWDSLATNFKGVTLKNKVRFCGGDADVAINASMPNALITHDRLFDRAKADTHLAGLLTKYLGCSAPLPDPAFPQR